MNEKILKLEGVLLDRLPNNYYCKTSLDCTNCLFQELPNGLTVKGDLILGDNIKSLPAVLTIYNNLILKTNDFENLFSKNNNILIGGYIITPTGKIDPPLQNETYLYTDDNELCIYNKKMVFDNFTFPTMYYFQSMSKDRKSAIQYTDDKNQKLITFSCENVKDGLSKVYWHKARENNIDKYKNYDVNILRSVAELKKIFQDCTGACDKGCENFIKDCKIDKKKKYSIEDLRQMLLNFKIIKWDHSPSLVFIEFFSK